MRGEKENDEARWIGGERGREMGRWREGEGKRCEMEGDRRWRERERGVRWRAIGGGERGGR